MKSKRAISAQVQPIVRCECIICCDGEHVGKCKECAGCGDRIINDNITECGYCNGSGVCPVCNGASNVPHDLCGQGGIVKKERDIPHQVDAVVSETIYVLHPGYITSKNDGDRHFIDAPTLAKLYGVPLHKCLIYDIRRPENIKGFVDNPNFKHLRPRHNGNYR